MMASPTDIMKRLGVTGKLVPFFKCVLIYFLLESGVPSARAVAAKCAPVLCLMVVVLLQHASMPYEQGWYVRRIALGLALSALGDALLVWPEHFVAGMAAFALAHVSYLAAFRFHPLSPWIGLPCYGAGASYLTLISPPDGLKTLVPVYAMLLSTMTWRALARAKADGGRYAVAAAVGAVLFLLSDAVLGYSLFGGHVRNKQFLVMSTYYSGQLGIALSALDQNLITRRNN